MLSQSLPVVTSEKTKTVEGDIADQGQDVQTDENNEGKTEEKHVRESSENPLGIDPEVADFINTVGAGVKLADLQKQFGSGKDAEKIKQDTIASQTTIEGGQDNNSPLEENEKVTEAENAKQVQNPEDQPEVENRGIKSTKVGAKDVKIENKKDLTPEEAAEDIKTMRLGEAKEIIYHDLESLMQIISNSNIDNKSQVQLIDSLKSIAEALEYYHLKPGLMNKSANEEWLANLAMMAKNLEPDGEFEQFIDSLGLHQKLSETQFFPIFDVAHARLNALYEIETYKYNNLQ